MVLSCGKCGSDQSACQCDNPFWRFSLAVYADAGGRRRVPRAAGHARHRRQCAAVLCLARVGAKNCSDAERSRHDRSRGAALARGSRSCRCAPCAATSRRCRMPRGRYRGAAQGCGGARIARRADRAGDALFRMALGAIGRLDRRKSRHPPQYFGFCSASGASERRATDRSRIRACVWPKSRAKLKE